MLKQVTLYCIICGKQYGGTIPVNLSIALDCPNCERPTLITIKELEEFYDEQERCLRD